MFKSIKAYIEFNRQLKQVDVLRKDMNKTYEKIQGNKEKEFNAIYDRIIEKQNKEAEKPKYTSTAMFGSVRFMDDLGNEYTVNEDGLLTRKDCNNKANLNH